MFLTEIDSRAAVKGSRDPLGLVPLWSHFGRHVVGNLTTVTGSVRGFTTTLLGYHFAAEVQERDAGKGESELALFLKFEQLAAYSRWGTAGDDEFRGVERVKRRLGEEATIRLSAQQADQILSNQKVYGLWGLFSGPARASGLLARDKPVLSPAAQEFVAEEYLSAVNKAGFRDARPIVDLLRQSRAEFDIDGKHRSLAEMMARLHRRGYSANERAFYGRHLRDGGSADSTLGLQGQVAELMSQLPAGSFDRTDVRALIKMASRRGAEWEPPRARLQRIDQLESLLVPADAAFGFLMGHNGSKVEDVAQELRKTWGRLSFIDADGLSGLKAEMADAFHDEAAGERWVRLGQALRGGDYETVLKLLVEHNGFVMGARNGSDPWVRVTKGVFEVRFRDAGQDLPAKEELESAWANNYFLNPLKQVVMTLREA